MKKKLLLLSVLALFLHAASWAYNFAVANDDGVTIYYNYSGSEATVTYKSYNDYSGDVVIPETVTYSGTTYSITSIGGRAFYHCSSLTSVTIPEGVTSIGWDAFVSCSSLTSITIPESVTSIGKRAFYYCSSLISVNIPEGVTSIGDETFHCCSSLTSVNIPEGVTSIGDYTFSGCSSLTSVNIPEGVTSIGDYAFSGCSSLTSVNIPEGVTSIGDYAFQSCTALTSITIPEYVTSIGIGAFSGCTGLVEVNYNAINCSTPAGTYNFPLFIGCTNLSTANVGNSVTNIPSNLFQGCSGLISVTIPESVTSIGKSAFYCCSSLISVNIPEGVTSIGDYAFYGCSGLFSFSVSNITQSTCQATLSYSNISGVESGFTTSRNTEAFFSPDNDGVALITNLRPESSCDIFYAVKLSNDNISKQESVSVKTKNLNPKITQTSLSPNAVTLKGSYTEGDATVTETGFNGYESDGENLRLTDLDPETKYTVKYYVIAEGASYNYSISFTTHALEFITNAAKATSNTVALIGATTNLSDDATGAGFEWRRYDAPDIMPSTQSACPVIDGELTGTLNGLSPNTYYMYRPYYTSGSGTTYYGDWIAFITADAYVYFEPVVRTYEASNVTESSAYLKGYAVQGSDAITSQGFEYWAESSAKAVKRASSTDAATKVEVSGQWMTAIIEDLSPGTTYSYRVFVTTAVGTTYGETQSFTTTAPTGIIDTVVDETEVYEVARYTIDGKKINTPQKGINIIRYSDGTAKKVLVK